MSRRLVVASLEAWDEVWRRNQYLIDGLLSADPELEVLFIEPPTDPLHALASGRRPARGLGLREAPGYGGRLRLLQSTKMLPRRAGRLAEELLTADVRRAVSRLRWSTGVLWVNDPTRATLLDAFDWPSLYDMTDDWVAAVRGAREHERITAGDVDLLRRCDEVVVCSAGLADTKGAIRQVSVIRNAVEVERYRRPADRPADLPALPVALYVGTLHEDRLDVDLVLATADAVAGDGVVVLLGPDALAPANSARLRAHPAVVVTGGRPRDSIPAYLQHAHALIVPHIVDDFTESLDPIKLYEYLAVGRPVVSTPVAGFRDAPVELLPAPLFPAAVAARLSHWEPSVEVGDVPDWSDRVAEFRAVLAPLLERAEAIG